MNLKIAKKGRPKDPQKAEVIRGAAGCLFIEHGFGATSMDAIAKQAGVSKQTLYSHFSGKDDLFRQVITGKVDSYDFGKLEKELFTGELEQGLSALGRAFITLILDEEAVGMMRMVISEAGKQRHLAENFYQTGPGRILEIVQGYLEQQQRQGAIPACDAYDCAMTFLNMLKGEWHMQALMGMPPNLSDDELDSHVRRCVQRMIWILDKES